MKLFRHYGVCLNIYATLFTGVTRFGEPPGCLTRREAQRTPVQWTKAAVLAFLKINHKLSHFVYNYIIDPEAPLFIYADSSLTAIGSSLNARIKGCVIAGRIHVEKLESDTDSLPNL